MSQKTVKIEFVEQSKTVTAQVKIEVSDEEVDSNLIMSEAKRLFDEAMTYSTHKTMIKNR